MRLWRLIVASAAEVEQYRVTIENLSVVAYAQVKQLLQSLDTPNPIEFRDALLVAYPELMQPYLGSSSLVAAEWYRELRVQTPIVKPFTPKPAAPPPDAQLEAGVRFALTPLFKPTGGGFIGDQILALLAGFSQSMIAGAGRDTISGNAYADPVRTGWARVPAPGCCSFCGLMASRGPVYSSEEAATTVGARGVDAAITAGKRGGQGRGAKVRGSQNLGDRYHAHCRCVATPVFPGGDNDMVTGIADHFTDMLSGLESPDGSVRAPGEALTLKGVLADWRFTHGTK